MRKEITVAAEPRESRGKNEARRLRVKGLAPAVLYGSERPRRGGLRESQGHQQDSA